MGGIKEACAIYFSWKSADRAGWPTNSEIWSNLQEVLHLNLNELKPMKIETWQWLDTCVAIIWLFKDWFPQYQKPKKDGWLLGHCANGLSSSDAALWPHRQWTLRNEDVNLHLISSLSRTTEKVPANTQHKDGVIISYCAGMQMLGNIRLNSELISNLKSVYIIGTNGY